MDSTRIEECFIDIAEGSLFIRTWTPGNNTGGSPIVLLHDSLGSVDLWRGFPIALAQHLKRSVIAYDRLGFGKSSPRTLLPSLNFIDEEAQRYFPAVRKALGLNQYSLFGHSVGGAMALMIGASKESGCEMVITESAQSFVEPRTLAGIRASNEQFKQPEQFNKLTKWHGDKAQWVLDAWVQTWLSPEFATWNLDSCLDQIHCPVLAIHGDLDEYGSLAFPNRIVKGVRGLSRLAILEKCGHVPHREQQERVLEIVSSFLGRSSQTK